MYVVTYLTVNGQYEEPFTTKQEAKQYVARLKKLNKQPGYSAAGVQVKELV